MAASLGYITALWCVLHHMWWTNVTIKSPFFYKNAIFFVDPITRQTYPDAQVQNCSDRIKNLFQFDMEDENSSFTFTPTLEHRKRPAVFGPKDVTPVSRKAFGGAGDAGIYTRAQLSEFWDNILISAASRKALQKFSRELIVPNTAIHGPEQYSYYLIMPPERISLWITWFPPASSKISLWTRLDQLPMSWILWDLFLLLPVCQAHRWSHSHDFEAYGN